MADTSQDSTGGRVSQGVLGVFRALLYAGLVLLLGGLGFLLVLWPAGRSVARVRRVLWVGWGATVLAGLGGPLLQGPYAAGRSPAAVVDPGLLTGVLGTGYGIAGVVRLVLLAALVPVLRGLGGIGRRRAAITGVLGLGVLVTTSVVGHAGSGDLALLALPADVLHLAAASAWIGGLVLLAVVLLRRDPGEQLAVLPRWSRYAAASVGVLTVTGAFAGWREVREWGALFGTTYGRLLLIKIGLVAAMRVLGALGRAWIVLHRSGPPLSGPPPSGPPAEAVGGGGVATAVRVAPAPPVARLRRGVLLETGLAVTSSRSPPRGWAAPPRATTGSRRSSRRPLCGATCRSGSASNPSGPGSTC
ncbi:MAG: copper transport protein [Pseudonocardiales bacterium]|nr:copper transport protein [Pseudonocardiales bacterium]